MAQKADDHRIGHGQLVWPGTFAETLEAQFAEEDQILAQYGKLEPADWLVTRVDTGESEHIRRATTSLEAIDRAMRIWKAKGAGPIGKLEAKRLDPVPSTAEEKGEK